MKLSQVLDQYLLTSVNEGVNLVHWGQVFNSRGTSYLLTYTSVDLDEYEALFDDQDITRTAENRFVISCDGEPWEFAAWAEAWTKK